MEELHNKSSELGLDINLLKAGDKDELILSLIKHQGGFSKMKVNNQVASNPIGYYEAGKNFADLPCRLTHFTRTNFKKYNFADYKLKIYASTYKINLNLKKII